MIGVALFLLAVLPSFAQTAAPFSGGGKAGVIAGWIYRAATGQGYNFYSGILTEYGVQGGVILVLALIACAVLWTKRDGLWHSDLSALSPVSASDQQLDADLRAVLAEESEVEAAWMAAAEAVEG